MHTEHDVELDADGPSPRYRRQRYHHEVTDALCAAAVEAFTRAGGRMEDLRVVVTPGAFELTAVCQGLARRDDLDGVVALGCVIRGETAHDQYICESVAHGLTNITLATGKPVAFGLLTCHTKHQARERAGGGKGNKGTEAMAAVIETVRTLQDLTSKEATTS